MTKPEIIKQLKIELSVWESDCKSHHKTKDALKAAIERLEQEEYYKDLAQSYEKTIVKLTEAVTEQQPNEDCVSRQAVLEIVNDWWGITSTSGEPTLCDCIRELPPVTSTRKKGKWIKEYVGCMYDVCSECRQKIVSGYFEFNYCPNCGAEMESEE